MKVYQKRDEDNFALSYFIFWQFTLYWLKLEGTCSKIQTQKSGWSAIFDIFSTLAYVIRKNHVTSTSPTYTQHAHRKASKNSASDAVSLCGWFREVKHLPKFYWFSPQIGNVYSANFSVRCSMKAVAHSNYFLRRESRLNRNSFIKHISCSDINLLRLALISAPPSFPSPAECLVVIHTFNNSLRLNTERNELQYPNRDVNGAGKKKNPLYF